MKIILLEGFPKQDNRLLCMLSVFKKNVSFYFKKVIDNLGPLELILNTPSHHRVHHGEEIWSFLHFLKTMILFCIISSQLPNLVTAHFISRHLLLLLKLDKPHLQSKDWREKTKKKKNNQKPLHVWLLDFPFSLDLLRCSGKKINQTMEYTLHRI